MSISMPKAVLVGVEVLTVVLLGRIRSSMPCGSRCPSVRDPREYTSDHSQTLSPLHTTNPYLSATSPLLVDSTGCVPTSRSTGSQRFELPVSERTRATHVVLLLAFHPLPTGREPPLSCLLLAGSLCYSVRLRPKPRSKPNADTCNGGSQADDQNPEREIHEIRSRDKIRTLNQPHN